jgi:hypothetical protein
LSKSPGRGFRDLGPQWCVVLVPDNPAGDGGIVGASANEAQAMRDACLSIEEKLAVF